MLRVGEFLGHRDWVLPLSVPSPIRMYGFYKSGYSNRLPWVLLQQIADRPLGRRAEARGKLANVGSTQVTDCHDVEGRVTLVGS